MQFSWKTRVLALQIVAVGFVLGACGSESSSDLPAESSQAELAAPVSSQGIYQSALVSPWADYSWVSRSLTNTAPVAMGSSRSISVTYGAWQGLYFNRPAIASSAYASLVLQVNGGQNSRPKLQVRAVLDTGVATAGTDLGPTCVGGVVPMNTWANCAVPITSIAPAGSKIMGIVVQEWAGKNLATVYFDDIGLTAVAAVVSVSVSPTSASLFAGETAQFTASVTGSTDTNVTWSVEEGSAGGVVSSTGLYTAPSTAGAYHVIATSQADTTKSATGAVTVTAIACVPETDAAFCGSLGKTCGTASGTDNCGAARTATCGSACTSKESWVWPYNTNIGWSAEAVAIANNAAAFTHLSPTFYSLNYTGTYSSGVPYYVTCPGGPAACTGAGSNNFGTFSGLSGASASYNGQAITTESFTAWAHSIGFKVVPLIYAGSGNGGVDTSVEAILCNGNGASGCLTQRNFINALVTELTTNNYDGWNLDWEMGSAVNGSYASSFVAFVNAFKAALVSAGRPSALLTVDAIVSNVNGTYCSGNSGYLDFGLLSTSSIDRVIVEDYSGTFQTAGWTVPTSCQSPLKNYYGSAALSSASPAGCDYSFTGMMIMMCNPNLGTTPALDFDKAVIGIMPSVNGTNPIAGQAMQYLTSFGYTKVAVWPQYDNNANQFMSTDGMVPAGSWYTLLETWLAN